VEHAASYYPGRRYVDWLEVSDYGEQKPSGDPSRWFSFSQKLGDPSDPHSSNPEIRAIAPDKPIALIEFGVAEDPGAGDKGAWIGDAFDRVTPGSPGFTYSFDLVSYWSERWRNGNGSISDLRVNSSPGALAAHRTGVADEHFVSTAEFHCG
jgi:hypothetical protein